MIIKLRVYAQNNADNQCKKEVKNKKVIYNEYLYVPHHVIDLYGLCLREMRRIYYLYSGCVFGGKRYTLCTMKNEKKNDDDRTEMNR